jgi:cold shock CspA family protein
MIGEVKWYNIKQCYGFIKGKDGVDVFVHKKEIPFWTIFLKAGDKVEYKKEYTKKGIKAKELKLI